MNSAFIHLVNFIFLHENKFMTRKLYETRRHFKGRSFGLTHLRAFQNAELNINTCVKFTMDPFG